LVYWDESRLVAQHERLQDAKEHADLYIQTDELGAKQVLSRVVDFLTKQKNMSNS